MLRCKIDMIDPARVGSALYELWISAETLDEETARVSGPWKLETYRVPWHQLSCDRSSASHSQA